MEPKSPRLGLLSELTSAITLKFTSPDVNRLSPSVLSSLSASFSKLIFKLSRALQSGNSPAVLRCLEKLSPLCRRFYFASKGSAPGNFAAVLIRFFTEFQYPIDLTAPFHDDDVALRYAVEYEDGREIVTRTCVRLRPAAVVKLDLTVSSTNLEI
jgi:hypothetical protein